MNVVQGVAYILTLLDFDESKQLLIISALQEEVW